MAQWKALSMQVQSPDTPRLYIKGIFTNSSYSVFVTDMVYLWMEKLDRRAIMRRAMNEDTTIDPTNGPDQLKTLLEHLSNCLEGTSGTSMVLKSSNDQKELNIMLSSKLPPPLEPLYWPLTLSLGDHEQFSVELLHPALEALRAYRIGVPSLVSLLKDKDYVIQKLQDKIEVSGMDLSAVFPGAGFGKASNVKKPQREIPGLSPFDYDSWISTNTTLGGDPLAADSLPRDVDSSHLKLASNIGQWWENPSINNQELYVAEHRMDKNALTDRLTARISAGIGPAGRARAQSPQPQECPMQNVAESIPERNKQFRKGSQSSTSSEEDVAQFEQLRPQTRDHNAEVEVEDTNRSKELVSSKDGHLENGAEPPNKPKKIGKLGGKKQSASQPTSPARVPETQDENKTELPATPHKKSLKLGKIGGTAKVSPPIVEKRASESSTAPPIKQEDQQERGGRAEAATSSNRERETSLERADRRRADLKRQLEEKKRAPGAKKKQRKF